MRFLRLAAIILAAVIAIFVVIGLLLPRQWNVEVTTMSKATPAQLMPLVRDFRQWTQWTTAMPETTYSYSDQQGQVGSWMSWSGRGSKAKFIVTEVTDTRFKFDEQMESDTVNAHGEITAVAEANGTRLSWKDTGTLPPILGGYFRTMMESALTEHMKLGLGKLSKLAEAAQVEAPPAVVQAPPEVVDAGSDADADAGAEVDAGMGDFDAGVP